MHTFMVLIWCPVASNMVSSVNLHFVVMSIENWLEWKLNMIITTCPLFLLAGTPVYPQQIASNASSNAQYAKPSYNSGYGSSGYDSIGQSAQGIYGWTHVFNPCFQPIHPIALSHIHFCCGWISVTSLQIKYLCYKAQYFVLLTITKKTKQKTSNRASFPFVVSSFSLELAHW